MILASNFRASKFNECISCRFIVIESNSGLRLDQYQISTNVNSRWYFVRKDWIDNKPAIYTGTKEVQEKNIYRAFWRICLCHCLYGNVGVLTICFEEGRWVRIQENTHSSPTCSVYLIFFWMKFYCQGGFLVPSLFSCWS